MPSAIFACTWEGCGRSFDRQTSLDRHERSHAGRGRHECRVCGKSYARSGVLSRHMVTQHGGTPPTMGRPRKVPCDSCISAHAVCSGPAPIWCRRCVEYRLECVFGANSSMDAGPSAVGASQLQSCSPEPSMARGNDFNVHSTQIMPLDETTDQPRSTTPSTDLFLLAATASDTTDWLTALGLDLSAPQPLDWGLGEPEPDLFDVFNTHAPNSPVIFQPPLPTLIPPLQQSPSSVQHTSPEDLHGVPTEIPDGQPFDSPWVSHTILVLWRGSAVGLRTQPHIDKPRDPDIDIALPDVRMTASTLASSAETLSHSSRETMLNIVSQSHQAVWPVIDTVNFPSLQTLTACVNLYHRHYHNCVPILEKESFRLDTSAPLLVMAMTAIGATYSRDGLQKLGVALNELVRRAVFYVRESDRRFMYETNIIQALFLQTSFAFFCGSQKAFQQAETSRSILVQACKRMHLLRPGMSACEALRSKSSAPDPGHLQAAEKEDRRRARLGWCIYILDAQLACLLNLPAQLSLGEVSAVFPTVCSLQRADIGSGSQPMFSTVIDELLTNGLTNPPLDDFGFAIASYTLYRMCIDAAAVQSIHQSHNNNLFPTLRFPSHIVQHPQHLLDKLRFTSMNTHLPPTPLLVSCAALANHAHLQFTRLGFIELVKMAAGKGGTALSINQAQEKLVTWVNNDQCGSRRVAAHAGMLSCLLARHTFDAPAEVLWTFDCALCLWAITLFSLDPIASGSRLVTITWSTGNEIDTWINFGGGAHVQGLGDLGTLTHKQVLQHFIERLDQLSWGLAQQYKQVLQRLRDDRL